ncbi:hypothetical protein ACXYTP_03055 [Tsukamurella ocularis]|uniref:hypothetical protein n=1 Tax=Tsukamurella ocularis TaxID=1970234 RepID=UPI0039EFD99C
MTDGESVLRKHRSEMLATGGTDRKIRKWLDDGLMTRVWRGTYHQGTRLAPWVELALSARAAAERSDAGLVLSHAAAAALLGMEVLTFDWRTVEFTRDGRRGGGIDGRRRVHLRRLDAEDRTVVEGLAVTTIARTALDLALAGTFEQAIAALDAALRMGVTRDELQAAVNRLGRRKGIAMLRAALPEADGRSESVGESRSRALMLGWPEIPRPDLQREFFTPAGALEARVDFLFGEIVVGEFDGEGKEKKGFDAAMRLKRDTELMNRGLWPTHWRWKDCKEPDRLRTRLQDALRPHGLLLDSASRGKSSPTPELQPTDE